MWTVSHGNETTPIMDGNAPSSMAIIPLIPNVVNTSCGAKVKFIATDLFVATNATNSIKTFCAVRMENPFWHYLSLAGLPITTGCWTCNVEDDCDPFLEFLDCFLFFLSFF